MQETLLEFAKRNQLTEAQYAAAIMMNIESFEKTFIKYDPRRKLLDDLAGSFWRSCKFVIKENSMVTFMDTDLIEAGII